ncbi:hypothetical protein A6070_00150 [Syntrophotalea acetylenica]|nr:hypothetical protein A6070_00150 [Syntrophotalea acetylenica]
MRTVYQMTQVMAIKYLTKHLLVECNPPSYLMRQIPLVIFLLQIMHATTKAPNRRYPLPEAKQRAA